MRRVMLLSRWLVTTAPPLWFTAPIHTSVSALTRNGAGTMPKQRGVSSTPAVRDLEREAREATLCNQIPPIHAEEASLLPSWMRKERTMLITPGVVHPRRGESVVYWMQRDVRTVDNWALLWASHIASSVLQVPLHVIYAIQPPPLSERATEELPELVDMPWTERHGKFLLGGLELVHQELKEKGIPLHVLTPTSHATVGDTVARFAIEQCSASIVIADFSPLRHFRQWKEVQARPSLESAGIPFYQVDAHNIVPVWIAADKRQVGARTLRPKIHNLINGYLQPFPELDMQTSVVDLPAFDTTSYENYMKMDSSVPVVGMVPGTKAAIEQFELFVKTGLKSFDTQRNDPVQTNICSNLSPWINHGFVSFATLTQKVTQYRNKYATGTASYIEEGVVRRELSDNYVYYTPNDYDRLSAAAGWAQETLQVHAGDPREYVYNFAEFAGGRTHDDLWNAAQLQLVRDGGMHGFLRMYWAKKILEWTPSPAVALATAQYLNDYFALDGRDPNGFVGVGWSIMGIHDMGWKERPVFGKIRFMNYAGCKRKFNISAFVARYPADSKSLRPKSIKQHFEVGDTKGARAKPASKKLKLGVGCLDVKTSK
jgi:deoxyribodipyrimidine photo-lyase